MPVQSVSGKKLFRGMNEVLALSDSVLKKDESKGHRYGFGEFNPFNMCLFFLLIWSIFNGILGFFVGHIFNLSSGDWVPLLIWIVFAIAVPVGIAVMMFRYFHSYKVVRIDSVRTDEEKGSPKESATSSSAAPSSDTASETDGSAAAANEESPASKKGWFSARCNNIASHYLLSKRETEVLFLLAKGHNAAFIQEQLCVSRSTAKTHINHIYRKLDIHTQQELLNMVENGPRGEKGRVLGSLPGVMQMDDPRKVMEEAHERAAATPLRNYRKDIFADKA